MMKIPNELLPHTITLRKFKSNDGFNKPKFEDEVSLRYMRVESTSTQYIDAMGEVKQASALLMCNLIDGISFNVDDVVVWDNLNYVVVKADKTLAYTDNHWEVLLVETKRGI